MKQELQTRRHQTFLTLEYKEAKNYIYCNWSGYVSTENVIKGAKAYLKLLEQTHCPYFLNNNQEVLGPWANANDWLEDVWIPESKQMGLKYMAHVQAPNIAAALAGQDLQRRVDGNFEMRIFGEFGKAVEWLTQTQLEEKTAL